MSRIGLLMKKLGCSFIFKEGKRVPITLLFLEENFVVSVKDVGEGLSSVVLMFGRKKSVNRAQLVPLQKLGLSHVGQMREFRVPSLSDLPQLKSSFDVSHFSEDDLVDASGVTIGKGFAGPMKRHNFSGLRASHGVSLTHRSGGSTGQRQDIGRTYKGRKMAGHMGARSASVQNLKIVYIDLSKSLIGVKGAVPGSKNSYVMLRNAVKG